MFSLSLFGAEPRYIRRARAYLQEARMAVLEHTVAAEHYQASAQMYAERARRLEEEIAHWEARKNGSVVVDPLQEITNKFAAPSRLESTSPPVLGAAPASVGIVRAA